MEINRLVVQYLLPGHDADPSSAAEISSQEDKGLFSYLEQAASGELTPPGTWRDLLGLKTTFPNPNQADPPAMPGHMGPGARADFERSYRRYIRTAKHARGQAGTPKFQKMIDLLADYHEATDRIRARSLEGAVL